jgi:hypothetical protein
LASLLKKELPLRHVYTQKKIQVALSAFRFIDKSKGKSKGKVAYKAGDLIAILHRNQMVMLKITLTVNGKNNLYLINTL